MNDGPRRALKALFREALEGVDPGRRVAQALARRPVARALAGARRIGVFACGKAAARMVLGAPAELRRRALVVLPKGYPARGLSGCEILFSAHPDPNSSSMRAARRAIAFFEEFGPEDAILCLISGGTSSLLALPRPGIRLASKRDAVRRLMRSGASIVEINRLRKSLSAVKGGKLGRRTRARLVTLVLSDVPGDDPALVGSGPTIRAGSRDTVQVVGSNRMGLEGAARAARDLGLEPRILSRRLSGEAREEGRRFARRALRMGEGEVLLSGGETTVAMSGRGLPGRGGRNLEFVLGAAIELDGIEGVTVLSAGSDGIDGSSRAAGAVADGSTLARARRRGLDPRGALDRHDTEPFFDCLGDLVAPGPTGTNVCDWAFAFRPIRWQASSKPPSFNTL
jgi:hydroxypyruvate reductase